MIIVGNKIAKEVLLELHERVSQLTVKPRLTVFVCAPNFETKRYLALKEKKAELVGISMDIIELAPSSTTEDFVHAIEKAVLSSDGIIIQLPLPESVDTKKIVATVPVTHDVDVLNPNTTDMLSPVVGAIKKILGVNGIMIFEKFVTVIGSGRLVGLPAYEWFLKQGAHVSVVTRDTTDIENYTKNADIIVCGAGVPGLLKPDIIKEGVIILDAGTSEDGGELRGDADPECAEKASLFTPVPGGIGPITIAILLSNVVDCTLRK